MTYDHWKTTNPADVWLGWPEHEQPHPVYPLYVTSRVVRGLKDDADRLIADVGEVETVEAGSKYAVNLLDAHGTEYRVTVEVVS